MSNTSTFQLKTDSEGMYNITDTVAEAVKQSGVVNGIAVIYCPHTTAAITINENTDPNVTQDFLLGLARAFPDRSEFTHKDGNSAAHLKSSCIGCQISVIVDDGALLIGKWQAIYFCEFDGPRPRKYTVKVIADNR